MDPLTKSYPWYTPYQFAGNSPIYAIDLDGLEMAAYGLGKFKNDKPVTAGVLLGGEEFVQETWQFMSVDMWKRDTWKATGQLLMETAIKAHSPLLKGATPHLDAAVDEFKRVVDEDIINGDDFTRSKAGTKLTLGVLSAAVGDKGMSKLKLFSKTTLAAGKFSSLTSKVINITERGAATGYKGKSGVYIHKFKNGSDIEVYVGQSVDLGSRPRSSYRELTDPDASGYKGGASSDDYIETEFYEFDSDIYKNLDHMEGDFLNNKYNGVDETLNRKQTNNWEDYREN